MLKYLCIDMIVNLKIADPTLPSGLPVNLFGSLNTLPKFRAAGQIIRVHQLKVSNAELKSYLLLVSIRCNIMVVECKGSELYTEDVRAWFLIVTKVVLCEHHLG